MLNLRKTLESPKSDLPPWTLFDPQFSEWESGVSAQIRIGQDRGNMFFWNFTLSLLPLHIPAIVPVGTIIFKKWSLLPLRAIYFHSFHYDTPCILDI